MKDNVKDILNSGRRDKTEIIAAIAAMTKKPAKITHIMEHVSLSYPNLKTYIKLMLRLRLLETCKTEKSNGRGRVFQATEKGLAFFKTYCNLLRIIYGEDLLQKANNLAVACLNYCKETE